MLENSLLYKFPQHKDIIPSLIRLYGVDTEYILSHYFPIYQDIILSQVAYTIEHEYCITAEDFYTRRNPLALFNKELLDQYKSKIESMF